VSRTTVWSFIDAPYRLGRGSSGTRRSRGHTSSLPGVRLAFHPPNFTNRGAVRNWTERLTHSHRMTHRRARSRPHLENSSIAKLCTCFANRGLILNSSDSDWTTQPFAQFTCTSHDFPAILRGTLIQLSCVTVQASGSVVSTGVPTVSIAANRNTARRRRTLCTPEGRHRHSVIGSKDS